MDLDVILIVPPLSGKWVRNEQNKYEHLGCGYLLSSISSDISSGFIDAYNYELNYDEIIEKIEGYNPKIIGISCNFYNLLSSAVCLAEKIKRKFPEIHITFGGHGVVHDKERLIKAHFIDSICLCEGEICFPQFVESYLNGKEYWIIEGMWFRYNGEIYRNKQLALINQLDDIAFPTRTNNITSQTLAQEDQKSIYTVITSRGCPYNCVFCDIKAFYSSSDGKSWRMRSAKNIVDEVEFLYRNYKARYILFGDDNFLGSNSVGFTRAEEICNLLIERNIKIKFGIEARVSDIDLKKIKLLKMAGLVSVMLGVENADQRTLDRWNKRIMHEDSISAIKVLETIGIDCHVNYILYDAFTTLEDLMVSYHFFKKTGIYRYDDPIYLFENKLGVFPGTQTYTQLKQSGRLIVRPEIIGDSGFKIYNYDYKIENDELKQFIAYNNHWLNRIRKFRNKISNKDLVNYKKTSGLLYLKAFKTSIDLARTGGSFNSTELDVLLDSFEKNYSVT